MAAPTDLMDRMPVVQTLDGFNPNSGTRLERSIFNNRLVVVMACALITLLLLVGALTKLSLNASFEKMIPQSQDYIRNYLDNRKELRGLGNVLRIVVENVDGDIFDPKYQDTLRKINDELFLMPGVDRARARKVAAALRRASRGLTLGGASIKELVEDGRSERPTPTAG
mgnify:CR=1 FL=1